MSSNQTATEQVLGSAQRIRQLLTDALAENNARIEAAEAENRRLRDAPEFRACQTELDQAYGEHGQLRALAGAMGVPIP